MTSEQQKELFHTTRWSLVLAAADTKRNSQSNKALSELCQLYWHSVYIYLRKKGNDKPRAEDLTQGFFAQLLEKKSYAVASPERGRFRAFLITALKNYLCNVRNRETALKRGGNTKAIEFEAGKIEERYTLTYDTDISPEIAFDREWAQTLIRDTLEQLHAEYSRDGREQLFQQLKSSITHVGEIYSQATLAKNLVMSQAAVKSALQRLRKRFRALLREAVSHTAESTDKGDIDAEIRYLLECLHTAG
ncbi:MAG: sigma-70 family RNA polymerase sigma factor [Lentisphaeraceae bacterium]|nr:sigma-70 family RNA polymerase sigma factor [Lentisphaeraceae bacterium]